MPMEFSSQLINNMWQVRGSPNLQSRPTRSPPKPNQKDPIFSTSIFVQRHEEVAFNPHLWYLILGHYSSSSKATPDKTNEVEPTGHGLGNVHLLSTFTHWVQHASASSFSVTKSSILSCEWYFESFVRCRHAPFVLHLYSYRWKPGE